MRRQRSYAGILTLLIFLLLIGGGIFIYTSKQFERNAPKIIVNDEVFWNIKTPLKIALQDDSGIKYAQVTLSDGKNKITLVDKVFQNPQKNVELSIKSPKNSFIYKQDHFTVSIKTVDMSKWHFFSGNEATKKVNLIIDTKRPKLYIINNSYGIRKGGCALVVFKASDKNLKDLYIKTPFGKRFYPTPFYKKGYYISMVAWPIREKNFRADIVATDMANNISMAHIPLRFKPQKYTKSNITIKDNFLNGKVATFANNVVPEITSKPLIEQFIYINEVERKKDEKLISKITSKTDDNMIQNFNIKRFYPLRNSKKVARFGEFRTYFYKGKKISTSYHLGIDMASIRRAKIRASNKGTVVFADFNGIYGNNMIIYHGLGLYTLFGHCSEFLVQKDDPVKRGEVIARTGKTGMAMGDHLHFGVYMQGVAVHPKEWLDRSWIRDNITNVIKDAKKLINQK